MDSKIIFSIIVPIYNVDQFLLQNLSVLGEKNNTNLQIILVDDGSTDSSGELADDFASHHDNVQVIHQLNQGLSAARNKGLSLATGKYVCFIDSDDYIHPDYLSKMYEAAEDNQADMVICNFQKVGEGADDNTDLEIECGLLSKELMLKRLAVVGDCHTTEVMVVAWNKLIRTDIAKQIQFKEKVYHEDEFYINELIKKCNSIYLIDDVLYYYRQRSGSIMKSLNQDNFRQYVAVLEAYEQRIIMCKELKIPLRKVMTNSYSLNISIQFMMINPEYRDKMICHFFSKQALHLWIHYGRFLGKKRFIKWIFFILNPEYFLKRFKI